MPKLESWSVIAGEVSPYTAPELIRPKLHGKVYGHPRFTDGDEVTTSPFLRAEGEVIITASGTRYELGEVDPQYEKTYPNARERVFKTITGAQG